MRDEPARSGRPGIRRPWLRSQRAVPRLVVRPLERFLELEAGSAALLMAGAIGALVWANVAQTREGTRVFTGATR